MFVSFSHNKLFFVRIRVFVMELDTERIRLILFFREDSTDMSTTIIELNLIRLFSNVSVIRYV